MFHIDQLCCSGKKQVGVHCWKKRKCKQLGVFQVPVGVEPVWFIYFNIPIPERQYRRHRAIVAKTGLVSHIRCIVHFLATDSPQFCIVESMEKHAIKNSCIWVRFPITINYILFQRQGTDTTLCSASEGLHGRQTSVLRPLSSSVLQKQLWNFSSCPALQRDREQVFEKQKAGFL